MALSEFQKLHPTEEGLANPNGGRVRRLARQEKERRAGKVLTEQNAIDLLPRRGKPILVVTKLPTSGLVAEETGKELGGFPVELSHAKFDCSVDEWKKRMDLLNAWCSKVYSSKGRGKPKILEDRECTCEVEHGNVRLDVTFAIRHAILRGDGADFDQAWREAPEALQKDFAVAFPGVILAGLALHPPGRWRDALERAAGGESPDESTGLNLHMQGYMGRAFDGHQLTKHTKGFSHCRDDALAYLQEEAMGVDVGGVECARHAAWLREVYQMSESELRQVNKETGKPRFSADRVKDVLAVRAAVEAGGTLESEIQKRAGAKQSSLEFYRKHLAKSSEHQPAVNYWLAEWATGFLETRLVEINPKWKDYLAWGLRAAKHVIETRAAGGFSRPHYAILKDYEEADDARKRQAEHDEKLAAEAAEKARIANELERAKVELAEKTALAAKLRAENANAWRAGANSGRRQEAAARDVVPALGAALGFLENPDAEDYDRDLAEDAPHMIGGFDVSVKFQDALDELKTLLPEAAKSVELRLASRRAVMTADLESAADYFERATGGTLIDAEDVAEAKKFVKFSEGRWGSVLPHIEQAARIAMVDCHGAWAAHPDVQSRGKLAGEILDRIQLLTMNADEQKRAAAKAVVGEAEYERRLPQLFEAIFDLQTGRLTAAQLEFFDDRGSPAEMYVAAVKRVYTRSVAGQEENKKLATALMKWGVSNAGRCVEFWQKQWKAHRPMPAALAEQFSSTVYRDTAPRAPKNGKEKL